ncbi:MAG TPA: lauroyl acyltransferase [Roseiarcus sp.]|nr:lauroyl acyltransferase [Roseiarcus sp.]
MRAKIEAEYLGFQFVAWLLSALPLETASNVTAALWQAVAPRLKRHRRALAHLALAFPETSAEERERLARQMWGHLGRTFAELFHIDEIFADGRIVMESPEKLKMMREGGPFVVCAMHMGNWELLAGVSQRLARPLAGVYQPLSNRKVDSALFRLRAPLYPLGLFPRSPATLRKLMKIARDGGSVGFMSDLREGKGVAVPFFGRLAHSNTAPALIARAYGLKLYAARVIRKPGVSFTVRVEPVEVPATADRDADIAAATANIHACFEAFLREAPGQWMWAHRRWD